MKFREYLKEKNIDMKKIKKVMDLLKKAKADPDYASPNYVADFADGKGIKLTSDEVVHISDNYEG